MVRVLVILVLCIGNAIPRGNAVCCPPAPVAVNAGLSKAAPAAKSCCSSHRARIAHADHSDSQHPKPPVDSGKSCASPCCAKAPASIGLLAVLPLEFTPVRAAVPTYEMPETPAHDAIFHPPRA
ncbi:MAG: hypothetical protein IT450_12955 [Phycisphaerales bacterium]|nr:hypothetical protein [Phycisphaerales bacterium]